LMLQQSNPNYFMFGLGAFLFAHVFYIFAYQQHCGDESGHELQGLQKIRFALPIVLAGTGLVTILYNRLGDLKIPVLLYAGVLTYMVLRALFRFGRTNASSFAMVFGGAILFMISDSLIAINKFLEPLSRADFWVMTTYISAQYLIVKGLLKHS
ncbi:MAG TPA: lysoplasmalogenase, partial [Cyclobacteriaceae bacterium]|nr:lysoplasmalogenase [Cyclobacteriaceae bacterium]